MSLKALQNCRSAKSPLAMAVAASAGETPAYAYESLGAQTFARHAGAERPAGGRGGGGVWLVACSGDAQTRLAVNSRRHQALAAVAKPLRVVAVSRNGIVEGLELGPAGRHFLPWLPAVQFHPERLWTRQAEHLGILQSFKRARSGPRPRTV